MKSIAVFTILAFVASASAFTDEQLAKGKEAANACGQEHDIPQADIEKLKAGDFSNNNEKIQCFTNCFLEKVGFVKDGQAQDAVILEKLSVTKDKAQVEKLISACKGISGANNCETSYKLYKCYHENKP